MRAHTSEPVLAHKDEERKKQGQEQGQTKNKMRKTWERQTKPTGSRTTPPGRDPAYWAECGAHPWRPSTSEGASQCDAEGHGRQSRQSAGGLGECQRPSERACATASAASGWPWRTCRRRTPGRGEGGEQPGVRGETEGGEPAEPVEEEKKSRETTAGGTTTRRPTRRGGREKRHDTAEGEEVERQDGANGN